MSTQQPEWIALQNKQWTEEDGTKHYITVYNGRHISYYVTIVMPITNKHFMSAMTFEPLELTSLAVSNHSKNAKQNLLKLMLEELTLKK